MKQKINSEIIQLVADSLDVTSEKLHKNHAVSSVLTELFETSPHSGRNCPSMLTARINLSGQLVGTIRRSEVYAFIEETPDAAQRLVDQLVEVEKELADLMARCKKRPKSGNS